MSTAATMAGLNVLAAFNHWDKAIACHRMNHPESKHFLADITGKDFMEQTFKMKALFRRAKVLLASPACQGHSKARGAEVPGLHDVYRATAWAVLECASIGNPDVILVENVEEFLQWDLYRHWLLHFQLLGYKMVPYVLDAADFGVPQHRVRVYIVGTRTKAPFDLKVPSMPHVSAESIIEWGKGRWSPVEKPTRAKKTLEIIRRTRKEGVLGDTFLLPYYGNTKRGRCIKRPVGTITTVDKYAIIRGEEMRMMSVDEYRRAMGFPEDYRLPSSHRDAVKCLGNAVCPPVVAEILNQVLTRG